MMGFMNCASTTNTITIPNAKPAYPSGSIVAPLTSLDRCSGLSPPFGRIGESAARTVPLAFLSKDYLPRAHRSGNGGNAMEDKKKRPDTWLPWSIVFLVLMMVTGSIIDQFPGQGPGPAASLFTSTGFAIVIFAWQIRLSRKVQT